jgi:hypothetical protein
MSEPSDEALSEAPPSLRAPRNQRKSLDDLVGAHPDVLREVYAEGRPLDPREVGENARGRVLAVDPWAEGYEFTRPLVRAVDGWLPWRGTSFDHGGNSGRNRMLGRLWFRFRSELGPSVIDAAPTLVLRYDHPAHGNPWPFSEVVDELRAVGPGVALGLARLEIRGRIRVLLWFGLEAGTRP